MDQSAQTIKQVGLEDVLISTRLYCLLLLQRIAEGSKYDHSLIETLATQLSQAGQPIHHRHDQIQ